MINSLIWLTACLSFISWSPCFGHLSSVSCDLGQVTSLTLSHTTPLLMESGYGGKVLSQGLCICSSCWESSSKDKYLAFILIFFFSSILLSSWGFSGTLWKIIPSLHCTYYPNSLFCLKQILLFFNLIKNIF